MEGTVSQIFLNVLVFVLRNLEKIKKYTKSFPFFQIK